MERNVGLNIVKKRITTNLLKYLGKKEIGHALFSSKNIEQLSLMYVETNCFCFTVGKLDGIVLVLQASNSFAESSDIVRLVSLCGIRSDSWCRCVLH